MYKQNKPNVIPAKIMLFRASHIKLDDIGKCFCSCNLLQQIQYSKVTWLKRPALYIYVDEF